MKTRSPQELLYDIYDLKISFNYNYQISFSNDADTDDSPKQNVNFQGVKNANGL